MSSNHERRMTRSTVWKELIRFAEEDRSKDQAVRAEHAALSQSSPIEVE